ncbi:gag-pol, partial [Mucuna pruriens]
MAMNQRHEMPQQPILFCEVFDVWRIDLMGPFPISNGYSYILLAINYVSKWVEAIATKTSDAKVVVDFLKSNIFCRFGVAKALISNQGNHFCNRKYRVTHRIATAYHPQTNGQAKVFNREIKKTLQKMTNPSRKDWSRLLEDSFWAHKIAYRTPLGISPIGFIRLSSKKFQLQELDELFLEAYENSRIYKQKVKKFHDQQILRKDFRVGQKVLLFNSRLKLIAGKLRSRWDGPLVITNIFPYGVVVSPTLLRLSALSRDQARLSLPRSSRLSLCREQLGQCQTECRRRALSKIEPSSHQPGESSQLRPTPSRPGQALQPSSSR